MRQSTGDQRRGLADHRFGDVAVEIELGADRHALPDDGADPRQYVALAIIVTLGDHRVVQREDHHVDRQGAAQIREDLVAQLLVDGADDGAARLGEGAEALGHRPAPLLGATAPDMELCRAIVLRLPGRYAR
jgi:hypothetical protein